MKIKAREIQPGMVISRMIGANGDFEDLSLVISKKGYTSVEYKHFDYMDSYHGIMVGTMKGKEKIKVITGKKRAKVIKSIKSDLYRNLFDTERNIDFVWLILAMDKD